MHHDTKQKRPSLCTRYFGPNLSAFFDHLLAAAHQGNAAGVLRSGSAGAGFFHRQFKSAGIAMKQITFFHVTTICHGETSFGCYSGAIDSPLRRFLFRLTFFAIFADSVNTNFHFVNSAGVSLPQRFGVNN
jgi:hypothetical protein